MRLRGKKEEEESVSSAFEVRRASSGFERGPSDEPSSARQAEGALGPDW